MAIVRPAAHPRRYTLEKCPEDAHSFPRMATAARLRPGTRLADFPTTHEGPSNAAPADRVLALQEKLQDRISSCLLPCFHSHVQEPIVATRIYSLRFRKAPIRSHGSTSISGTIAYRRPVRSLAKTNCPGTQQPCTITEQLLQTRNMPEDDHNREVRLHVYRSSEGRRTLIAL